MKGRATKAITQARTEEVLRIRLDGAEFWDLREYVKEKEKEPGSVWELKEGDTPLSDSQLWRYMARADQLLAESSRISRKRLMRRHLAQRRNLYAKAVSAGDHRTALACLADEAKLQGLYPPTKVAPTNPKGDHEYAGGFTDEERRAALERLYALLGAAAGTPALAGPADDDRPALGGPDPGADRSRDDAGPLASDLAPLDI